jgi:hypothetical protein
METRIDRIERYIEEFAKGMLELKESQKQTDAQLNRTDAQLKKTIKKLDEIGANLGNMGIVQGEVAEYRDSKILAGIGALVVKDDVGRYAEKSGLFVLTQSSDGGATLMNRKNFRPKEFS